MVVRFISSLILSLILRVESNVLNMFLQSCVILLSWPQSWEDSHVFDIMVEGHHTQSIVVVRLPLIRYTFLFSSIPLIIFASLRSSRSLCLLVVSHIRGHISGSSPPLPTTVRALHFYRENISALSSLVDSCRIMPTHGRRSRQRLILFLFLQINSKSHHGGIRTSGPTLLMVLIVTFEGNL